jgi:hypothetical protein
VTPLKKEEEEEKAYFFEKRGCHDYLAKVIGSLVQNAGI